MSRILWVDIEGTGLDPLSDVILEIGLRITDVEGNTLDKVTSLVWNPAWKFKLDCNPVVRDMHNKSGLTEELEDLGGRPIRVSYSPEVVAKRLAAWVTDRIQPNEGYWPMAGNSVHYDRSFLSIHMPHLLEMWHYRNLDVSSLREVCRLVNPALFAKLPTPAKTHRPQQDLDESIKLWRWMMDNFLFVEDLPTD
jgi:oligoribonuclease